MPLLYARIVVDDKPGSLAAVTRGLAAAGADIVTVDVLGSEGGLAVDDFVLRVADGPLGRPGDPRARRPARRRRRVRAHRPRRHPNDGPTSTRSPGCSATRAVPCRPSSSGSRGPPRRLGPRASCRSVTARSSLWPGPRTPRATPSRASRTAASAGGEAVMVRDPAGTSTVTAYCEIRAGGPVVAVVREGGPVLPDPRAGPPPASSARSPPSSPEPPSPPSPVSARHRPPLGGRRGTGDEGKALLVAGAGGQGVARVARPASSRAIGTRNGEQET